MGLLTLTILYAVLFAFCVSCGCQMLAGGGIFLELSVFCLTEFSIKICTNISRCSSIETVEKGHKYRFSVS